ncbi:hypothetical protein HPB47_027110, partial [Ixodes persulcatus]
MAEQGDVLRQSSCHPRRHIRPRSRGWAAALWSLTITTAVLLLVSIVITAFVTTTLLNPSFGRRPRAPAPSELPNLTSQSRRGLMKAGGRHPKPCDSIACIERANLLLRQINKSRDPCDDFYAYVCNDWKLTRPLSPGADRVSMDTVLVDAYADLVASQLQDTGSQFPELEFLMDRCLHPEPELFDDLLAMFLDATDMRPWMTGLAKMRLPPAELSRTLGLAFRQLAIDSIFRFSVSHDILNKTKRFIALGEPSTVLLHGPLEEGEYELVHLGFSPVLNILRKFVETDVLRFEDRLSRLFARPQLDSAAMADCIIIKVRDLPSVQGIEWTDLLQSVFDKGLRPITSRTYIKLTSPNYVVRLARGDLLISSRDFMGYLLFRMIMVLSPLMKDDKAARVAPKIYKSLFRTIYHWIYNFEFENGTRVARHLEDLRLCLESQYSALLWLDKQVQLNASRTSWADLWDFMALRPSLEAFLLLASRVSSNYRLRLLEHWTTSQLFFVFYAANFCENSDRRFLRRRPPDVRLKPRLEQLVGSGWDRTMRHRATSVEVVARLSAGDADDYDKVKSSLLKRYRLSAEAFRQRFRNASKKSSEGYSEFAYGLKTNLIEWLKSEEVYESRDKVVECVCLEQFFRSIPQSVKLWVQDRVGVDSVERAAELAEEYATRRKLSGEESEPGRSDQRKTFRQGNGSRENGPEKPEAGQKVPEKSAEHSNGDEARKSPTGQFEARKPFLCYNCQEPGHTAARCKKPRVVFSYVNGSDEDLKLLRPYLHELQ